MFACPRRRESPADGKGLAFVRLSLLPHLARLSPGQKSAIRTSMSVGTGVLLPNRQFGDTSEGGRKAEHAGPRRANGNMAVPTVGFIRPANSDGVAVLYL
jgi:hypothetical protein